MTVTLARMPSAVIAASAPDSATQRHDLGVPRHAAEQDARDRRRFTLSKW